MPAGKDVVENVAGADQILKISGKRLAPDAIDGVFQDVAKFTYFRSTDQDAGAHLLDFDMLRRKAGTRMPFGAGFPDEFVSV